MNGLYSFLQKENTRKFATDLKQLSKLLRIYGKHHSDKRTKGSKEILDSVIKNFGEYLSPSCKKVLDTILGRNFEKICPAENSFIFCFRIEIGIGKDNKSFCFLYIILSKFCNFLFIFE